MRIVIAGIIVLLLAGCELLAAEEPTPTIDRLPPLVPSATVLPRIPTENPDSFVGRSDPTRAALAAEGEPSAQPELSQLPTEASFPITVRAGDVNLRTLYFPAANTPASAVIWVHDQNGDTSPFDARLASLPNYHHMILNLRGYGNSGGIQDWSQAANDIAAAVDTVVNLPGVAQVSVIGLGNGGYATIQGCELAPRCLAAIALNPQAQSGMSPLTALQKSTLIIADAAINAPDYESLFTNDQLVFAVENADLAQNPVYEQIVRWLTVRMP